MEWERVERVDWGDAAADVAEALWRVPADGMEQELGLRENDAFEHVVPLARAAVDVLRAIRPLTGRGPLPFCRAGNRNEPISGDAIGYLYNREGWKDRHVPPGWRSSFSTVMNGRAERPYPGADRLVIDRLVIDLMLAHQPAGMSATRAPLQPAGLHGAAARDRGGMGGAHPGGSGRRVCNLPRLRVNS